MASTVEDNKLTRQPSVPHRMMTTTELKYLSYINYTMHRLFQSISPALECPDSSTKLHTVSLSGAMVSPAAVPLTSLPLYTSLTQQVIGLYTCQLMRIEHPHILGAANGSNCRSAL